MDYALSIPWGATSNILNTKVRNSSDNDGTGFADLDFDETGLVISTITDNEATPTVYDVAGSTIENITTIGTFAAPTATKCRLKKIDDTNNPGLVQLMLADARFAVAGARRLNITLLGVTDMAQTDVAIDLTGPRNLVNGNAGMVINNTVLGTVNSQTSFVLSTGSADNDAYNGCIIVVRDQTTPGQICVGVILDYTGASKTVTLVGDPGIFTMASGDLAVILPPNATTAEIEAALNGATLALTGSTFNGTVTVSIP